MIIQCLQLNGHEFEQTLGDGEGHRSLSCCSPWGCKESNMTQQLNKKPGVSQRQSQGCWEGWRDAMYGILAVNTQEAIMDIATQNLTWQGFP